MAKTEKPKSRAKNLAIELGVLQREANLLGLPSLIIIEGIDGSGKGTLLNKLILEIDARTYSIYSTHASDRVAAQYPLLWRMWNHVPREGHVQFFDRSAYYLVLDAWAEGRLPKSALSDYWEDILQYERQQAEAGAFIVKVFLTVSKKEQARRFKELSGNPKTAWRVTDKDWARHRQHGDYLEQVKALIAATDKPFARWSLIETDNLKAATVELYETLIAAFEEAIAARRRQLRQPPPEKRWITYAGPDHLSRVDLTESISRSDYKTELKVKQAEMHDLAHQIHELRIPVVMVYCGWDAAGKGGCIKRLIQGLDPRSFKVVPVGPPTKLELAHHYLWRFWREMPPQG
ncbi:MAG: phosphate--AMP phosphotransferase, partial [Verrucomicrobiota bacterium]